MVEIKKSSAELKFACEIKVDTFVSKFDNS